MQKNPKKLFYGALISILAVGSFLTANSVFSSTKSCPLTPKSAYQARNSKGVYYITEDCTKRPIRNSETYFSYFSSWKEVHVISPTTLAGIKNSQLSFMPWGPRKTFQNGSLLKTADNSNVYVVSNDTRRQITSEQVFTGLGYKWSWIETVDPTVMQKFAISDPLTSSTIYPDDTVVKYPDSPAVYALETSAGQNQKRYIPTIQTLKNNYRADHIITLPAGKTFLDVNGSVTAPATPTTPVAPTTPITPTTPTTPTPTPVTTPAVGTVTPGASTNDLIPLTDLGTRMYLGKYMGGLYPNGSNLAPIAHDTEGKTRSAAVKPINGKVAMISIGMSNTNQEFCSFPSPNSGAAASCNSWSFVGLSTSNVFVNHSNLTFTNCARGGQSAETWNDPTALNTDNGHSNNYNICDERLRTQGILPNQVQIAWVKVADNLSLAGSSRATLPDASADAFNLETRLGQIVRALKVRYPNIKQVFFSSRIYGGYQPAASGISPEPQAYEGGFAVKWLIQAQIDQMAQGKIVDSRAGDLSYSNTPWLGWSSYIWANGTTARQNSLPWDPSGLTWPRSDIEVDATHPADTGEEKIARRLLTFFLGSPYSASWFNASGKQTTSIGEAITSGNSAAPTPSVPSTPTTPASPTTPTTPAAPATPATPTTPSTPVTPPQGTNNLPTISLSSPTANASFTAGSNITLTANASDSDGTISNVEFLNGTTVLSSDTTNPYSYTWNNVSAGTYQLTARATDNRSGQTTSAVVTITVTAPVVVVPPPVSSNGQVNTANANSGFGTNVSQFNDWASEFSFKDAFRRARAWTCNGSCTYDTNGWPLSGQATTYLFAGAVLSDKYPSGQYIALYDAASGATISYNGSAHKNTELSQPGRDVLDVNPAAGDLSVTVNGHVQNIRVIMPGGDCGDIFTYVSSAADCPAGTYRSNEQTYTTQPFHSLFLQKMKNYKSIRFCWWMLPDPYPVSSGLKTTPITWAERPKISDAIWAKQGVPVEYMVQLANILNADPWFNIPHLANDLLSDGSSDPYVRQFATYVKDHLNSNLKAYIEYANEVWNGGSGGYEQANYAQNRGTALHLSADSNQARFFYQAQQSVRMFQIWNDVYGTRDTSRVVRVLAAQNANEWTGRQVMDWQDAYKEADALAGAPYIDVPSNDQSVVSRYSIDELFNYINNTRLPSIFTAIQSNITNTNARINNLGRPLEYVAYEGGQHLIELAGYQNNANMNRIMDAANRDSRMGTAYTNLLNNWKQSGGHIFEHFLNVMQYTAGSVGRFGLLESMLQDTSPKYDAVQSFISQNPKWW